MESQGKIEYHWPDKTILIAEDEPVNYRLLIVMLSKTGAKILHGADGLKTLNLFKENPQIDLILMDIKMPEMDGLEVTREIRKVNPTIPIVAQTAFAFGEEKNKLLEIGCNAFLTKPIDRRTLFSVIDKYLNKNVGDSNS